MKFWFMWKARGDKGMEEHVDTAFERARYFQQKIRESDGFELVMDQVKYPSYIAFKIHHDVMSQINNHDVNKVDHHSILCP